jgi:hypothetical protein
MRSSGTGAVLPTLGLEGAARESASAGTNVPEADCTRTPFGIAPVANARKPRRNWSQDVTAHSDALDLERDIFASNDPRAIARSLKTSAECSRRRKTTPFRSAMSMLTFYVNRAGKNLSLRQRKTLEAAKRELRRAFGRPPGRA